MPIPLANQTEPRYAGFGTVVRTVETPRLLHLWHLSSLDAPTVAVVWSLAFAWSVRIVLPSWVPILLALGTWTVYVVDRLLDARAGVKANALNTLRERHFFHWRHRHTLTPLVVLAACSAAVMVFTLMPIPNREHNTILAAVAFTYFSGVHGPRRVPRRVAEILTKELIVGVLFTTGCALPTLSRIRLEASDTETLWLLVPALIFFVALGWLNCHAIDRWECGACKSRSGIAAGLLACIGLGVAASLAHGQPRTAALFAAGAVSAVMLALLHTTRARLTPLTLRAAADLALLMPLVLVLR